MATSSDTQARTSVQGEPPDATIVNERLTHTSRRVASLGLVTHKDMLSAILKLLKAFNSVVDGITQVHPYLKPAMCVLTYASKVILNQAERDGAVVELLSKVSEVYALMTEIEEFGEIASMVAICGKIARQTLECADFITHYSETKSVWKRLGKHIFKETDAAIRSYSLALDRLMEQFRDRVARDTVVILHRTAEDLDFSSMEYAAGAGLNTSKRCLRGTRQGILDEIQSWIRSTEEDTPRILWLSGTAGKGKSAIAHTIANWSNELGLLGACFCFDRTRRADRRHEKIFTTVARDLADCDPIVRRELARAIHDDKELRHTVDIARQWQKLILGPIGMASKAINTPTLLVIDALDESGTANSREPILRVLTRKLADAPPNLRILVTSRALQDIRDALQTVSHVRHVSIDDIPSASAEHDVQLYISSKLAGVDTGFNETHFNTLARKSDGLFEWARLATEYIKDKNTVSRGPVNRYDSVATGTSSEKGARLLDGMYKLILAESMPEDEHVDAIPMFRSVMGQILASLEPLPMAALTAMRAHFPLVDDRYNVDLVIGPLSSLVVGTAGPGTPIRPLHSSFYDFLTEKGRSNEFFVDMSMVQRDLAFASLRVMECGLHFNICSLENSYLPNSAVPELEERMKESIPVELSYSCRFWGAHVRAASLEPSLAKEVEAFFDGERLLYWLEALALMKGLGDSAVSLSSIADWITGHAEYVHIGGAIEDVRHFVRTFGDTILHSTPHLYLSALPFTPTQSTIFRNFAAKFPLIPHIVAGSVTEWPLVEETHHALSGVKSVAISPDRKRIVSGASDGTIQVWDTETGEALGAPLQGHTDCISSVVMSADGKRIVSGSMDKTVRQWDAETGKELDAPLRRHTNYVLCVAISPDGQRIVSGSGDKTVVIWNVGTSEALRAPLQESSVIRCVAIFPDGTYIVSGSVDQVIRMWDAKTGEALATSFEGHSDSILCIATSPDGKCIISGSGDKTVRVWDAKTGEALKVLKGHAGRVLSVAISADGRRIASGSADKTIRLWDAETGDALCTPFQGHTDNVYSVVFSQDGKLIISGSWDTTIRVWDLEFLNGQQPFKACFSSNPAHTLCSASSLFQEPCTTASLTPDEEGWVKGPEGLLLLRIPIDFFQSVYSPGDTLVIPSRTLQLDLSCFAHGKSWKKCREQWEAARNMH